MAEQPPKLILPSDVQEQLQKERGEQPPEPPENIENIELGEVKEDAVRPWEAEEQREEEAFISKYTEGKEISDGSKKFLEKALEAEIDDGRQKFAVEWFDQHTDEIEGKGISVKNIKEADKVRITHEMGAFEELRTSKEYEGWRENFDTMGALRMDLRKKQVPLETQYIMLNFLEEKSQILSKEIEGLREKEKEELKREVGDLAVAVELTSKEKEMEELFKVQKELAEKATGRDLNKEGEDGAKMLVGEQKLYVDSRRDAKTSEIATHRQDEIIQKELAREPEKYKGDKDKLVAEVKDGGRHVGLSPEESFALLQAGYRVQDARDPGVIEFFKEIFSKGLFKSISRIRKNEDLQVLYFGDEKRIMAKKEIKEMAQKCQQDQKADVLKQAEKELGDNWDKEIKDKKMEKIRKELSDISSSPDKAVGGIEGMYKNVKERIIAEHIESEMKKEGKTAKELKDIEKTFGKADRRKKNFSEFARETVFREGDLEKLTGELDDDVEILQKFLKEWGVNVPEKTIKGCDSAKYKEALKRRAGLLGLFIEFIAICLREAIKSAKKSTKRTKS